MNAMLSEALSEIGGLLRQLLDCLTGQDEMKRQQWLEEFKKFLRKEPCWIGSVTRKAEEIYTRLISGEKNLELDETDGNSIIAGATEVFPGWIDPDFSNYGCNVKSKPTGKMKVSVHEMTRDGKFTQIFNSMSSDLNSLCLTQSQIIQFVQKHRKWLRDQGYGTFFLFKVGEKFFVALVFEVDLGRLWVYVRHLSNGYVWDAKYRPRIVVPQLTLVPSVA
jgi:hypothetical protein